MEGLQNNPKCFFAGKKSAIVRKNPTNLPNPKWLPSLGGLTRECNLGEHDSSRVGCFGDVFVICLPVGFVMCRFFRHAGV